jgi:uncharacterized protein
MQTFVLVNQPFFINCTIEGMNLEFSLQSEQQRYVAIQNNVVLGFAEYRPTTGALVFSHTEVSQSLEGQGVASGLIGFAFADVRQKGLMVVPMCPFVVAFIKRYRDEYLDLVMPAHRAMFGL